MIPYHQTKTVVKNSKGETIVHGNCLQTVVACILEIPITEVPNVEVFYRFNDSMYWSEVLHTFLELYGYEMMTDERYKCYHPELLKEWERSDYDEYSGRLTDSYYLISGESPRGVRHITIWMNGIMIHDPHPSGDGILINSECTFSTIMKKRIKTDKP